MSTPPESSNQQNPIQLNLHVISGAVEHSNVRDHHSRFRDHPNRSLLNLSEVLKRKRDAGGDGGVVVGSGSQSRQTDLGERASPDIPAVDSIQRLGVLQASHSYQNHLESSRIT